MRERAKMNEYFTRFGAADYNIFHNGNTSYVMLRVVDEDMTYFALFERIEGHDGVGCRMFNSPTEVVLDDAVDETCSDEQLADFVGQPDTAFVHRFAVRVPPPLGAGRNHSFLFPYYA